MPLWLGQESLALLVFVPVDLAPSEALAKNFERRLAPSMRRQVGGVSVQPPRSSSITKTIMPPIIKIGQSIGRNIGHGIVPSHALFHHCMQSHHDHMANLHSLEKPKSPLTSKRRSAQQRQRQS